MCPTNSQLSPLLDDGITQEDRKPRRENRLVPRDHALNCRQVELSVLETLKWKRPVSYICAFLEYSSPPEMVLLYVFFSFFFFFSFSESRTSLKDLLAPASAPAHVQWHQAPGEEEGNHFSVT